MEFLNYLREDWLSKKLIEENYSHDQDFPLRTRFFEGINFNNDIMLSIQASGVHSSKPSKTLKDVTQYEAFELGIHSLQIQNYVTFDFATSDKKFSKAIKEYFDGYVYNNVPVNIVEEIFQKLKEEHGIIEAENPTKELAV